MLKKVSKNTVAAQVINQLTDLIRHGDLKPGDRLPSEREMAEQLGVSRPPLRESLRALEYAGIIETRYGDGIYVKSDEFPIDSNPLFSNLLNQFTLEEMIEMRKIVEKAAVRLAIERSEDDDFASLRTIHQRSEACLDDKEKFIECDFAFHSAIAEATANSMLFKTVQTMRKLMSEFNHELLDSRSYRNSVTVQHGRILEAMVARDHEAALEAMDCHLDNVVNLAIHHRAGEGDDGEGQTPGQRERKSAPARKPSSLKK